MDYQSIPREAIQELAYCTSAEDIMQMANGYGIPLTQEQAEALLMSDVQTLSELNGCGNNANCGSCKHGTFLKDISHVESVATEFVTVCRALYWCSYQDKHVVTSLDGSCSCDSYNV